ncbi:MAG TPA: FecR family protein, partial [Steroidobacteraceae bacterium]|nr:FecR family protein [Steroidobacteraceae bacterium]
MRHIIALLFSASLLLATPAVLASPGEDEIVLAAFKGAVEITSRDTAMEPHAGAVLELAATLRTGADGSAELRQGDTSIGVGSDTKLEFPAQAAAGPIDRVSQPSGNAFYSVGPRGSRKMRVETPYLVAVIKGTQFNVAVTGDSSTISLHEGMLEIQATADGIAPVILRAGEVAVRRKDEPGIRVLRVGAAAAAHATIDTAATPSDPDDTGPLPGDLLPTGDEVPGDELIADAGSPTLPVDIGLTGDAGGVETGIDAGVELGAGTVDVGLDTGIDIGVASVDAGIDAGVDLGAGTVNVGLNAGVDIGAASVDAGIDAGVDLGAGAVEAGVDAGIDTAVASVDAGIDAGVDLGAGTVEAGVDAGIDTAVASVDAGVDAGVDLGSGTVDAGVDAGVAGVDAGVDVGVDLSG